MLTFAASMEGLVDDVERAKSDPLLDAYVKGFGRDGDLGVVALSNHAPVGAAWLRLLAGEPHSSKLWTTEVPELAIATLPEHRGGGVGSSLTTAIVDAAHGRYPAIVLSVREASPAVRLYERFGFVVERRLVNRVGGASLAMRRELRVVLA
jgi:ribosomal protein S18 acetylase RimI-like enzyme